MDQNQAKELLQRYLLNKCTPAEKELVELWHEQLYKESGWEFEKGQQQMIGARIRRQLEDSLAFKESLPQTPAYLRTVSLLNHGFLKYAAVILLLLSVVVGYYILHPASSKTAVTQAHRVESDVMPGSSRAILTLSNGQQVQLSKLTSETIHDGSMPIENNNGRLNYNAGSADPNAEVVAINVMTTPKGGQYQLSLADGTKVWLNAASSITFPTRFTGNKREVSITGEVYFEVSKNTKKPFIVKSSTDEITVLGTAFNVKSYSDEIVTKTTLIEGAVKIGEHLLKPGQAYTNGKIISANIEQDVAWKNGIFNFQNLSFQEAAKQLERWYDIKIIYKSSVPNVRFEGDMDRGINLSGIIRLLSVFGVNARIEDRKLIVE